MMWRYLLSLAIVMAPTLGVASPPTKTLDEILETALRRAPDLRMADENIDAAERRATAASRQRLPTLGVSSNLNVWSQELSVDLGGGEALVIRDYLTTQSSLNLTVPLSTQLVLKNYVEAQRANAAATRADAKASRADLLHTAASGYLQLLEAQAAQQIAALTVKERGAQLERARALHSGGALERVDVMRLEAALAVARQQEIAATVQADSLADSLAVVIGAPGHPFRASDDLPKTPQAPGDALQVLSNEAVANRPELASLRARATAADYAAKVERAPLYPNLVGVGSYQYNTGQGPFAPKTALFVGLSLQWNLWDWGHQWNLVKAAEADATRARLAADQLADRLSLEARRRLREAEAAFESLAVAKTGLDAAEEAYRIQSVRYAEGATTTTDLLTAEAEVASARLGFSRARYTYFAALVGLAHAAGLGPKELLQ